MELNGLLVISVIYGKLYAFSYKCLNRIKRLVKQYLWWYITNIVPLTRTVNSFSWYFPSFYPILLFFFFFFRIIPILILSTLSYGYRFPIFADLIKPRYILILNKYNQGETIELYQKRKN